MTDTKRESLFKLKRAPRETWGIAPREPNELPHSPKFLSLIVWQGLLLCGITLFAFAVGTHWQGDKGNGLRRATTTAFMTLVLTQVFHAFNTSSQKRPIFTSRLFTNG